MDFAAYKRNELAHQERKYGSTPRTQEPVTVATFERKFLTPAHRQGGSSRGELFSRCVAAALPAITPGVRVLDYACGRGDLGVYLALKGATVDGMDVSPAAIDVARRKAAASGVDVRFASMDCEALAYPDQTFDLVVGFEALHHVIVYPRMPAELARIMKPGSRAIFAENWGADNPLFQMWRRATSLRKANSSDRGEIILGNAILRERLSKYFAISVDAFAITYTVKKYVRGAGVLTALRKFDRALERVLPSACGESVITLTRR
jgi:2-polyprenyl-3-methyl-5-hydroxy-6-metoxy-1,4-benzoquinol methylase